MTKPDVSPAALSQLPPCIADLIRTARAPVDTSSPVDICQRLAFIEDDLARLQPALAEAAFQRLTHEEHVDGLQAAIKPEGSNAEQRKHHVAQRMQQKHGDILDQKAKVHAAFKACEWAYNVLDTRRSILQSALKVHLKEQEPRHGQGAGNTSHLRDVA